nr:reverse transcriptase domain-containing protein [Tanacetum cinerariifolium]
MLGEHNITYRPRTSVKGQILADFLIEMPGEDPQAVPAAETQEEPWTLFTDGSSCVDGSGTGLILTSPGRVEFTYALRFQFTASNNEAEYEALVAGLRIAVRMGVKNVYLRAFVQTSTSRSAQRQIHKGEGSGNGDRGRRTDLDDTVSGLLKRRSPPWRQEGCKKASPQGPTIRVNGGGPLQKVVPYTVVKMRRTAPGGTREGQIFNSRHGLLHEMDRSEGSGNNYGRIGIKSRLGEGNKNWIKELPHVLWAHRTMIKSSHGDTPFSLTYGTEAVIPTEIGMPTYRTAAVDVVSNDEELRLNLDLLEERRERMTKYYNARVRGVTFKPGDFVYRSNDASHAVAGGKLGPKWEGPYEVTEALGNGAYKLRSIDGTILPRTWNIANLKRCYL